MAALHRFTPLRIAGLVLMLLLSAAPAWPNDTAPVWLANIPGEPALGRLTIKDDTLTFALARTEWSVPLFDIRKISIVKGTPQILLIETVHGHTLRLHIRDAQLLAASPKPAVQRIQRAMKQAAPSSRPVLVASAPAPATIR